MQRNEIGEQVSIRVPDLMASRQSVADISHQIRSMNLGARTRAMSDIEFIRLNGQAVRVTSFRRNETTGSIEIVVVARGTAVGQNLSALGQQTSLEVEVPDEPSREYRVAQTDLRSSGEGEQAVHRVKFTLQPMTTDKTNPVEHETQLDRIERKLDELLKRLEP